MRRFLIVLTALVLIGAAILPAVLPPFSPALAGSLRALLEGENRISPVEQERGWHRVRQLRDSAGTAREVGESALAARLDAEADALANWLEWPY